MFIFPLAKKELNSSTNYVPLTIIGDKYTVGFNDNTKLMIKNNIEKCLKEDCEDVVGNVLAGKTANETTIKKEVKDITDYNEVEDYLVRVLKKEANNKSGLVYGMGHAIYTLSDPRAKILKEMARKLAQSNDKMDDFLLCDFIETKTPELQRQMTGVEKPMCANVDLYSGFVYEALGIPPEIATPLFATARLSGWCAHRLEELTIGKKLMRPAYDCVEEHREYIEIGKR